MACIHHAPNVLWTSSDFTSFQELDVDMIKRRCAYNIEVSIEKLCLQAPALLTS